MKKGILVVSFGTTYRETREKNIEAVERCIGEEYPKIPVYRAFSSRTVRRILLEREGLSLMDTREALARMKADGITHVYIQPTFVIDGVESNRLKAEALMWKQRFDQVKIGTPLLTDEEDYEKVVDVLYREYLDGKGEAGLVLIGHGTDHESHESYERLEKAFRLTGHGDVYIATVEGGEDMGSLLNRLKRERMKRTPIRLAPLMLVAGDHANHDMTGDENSYLSCLRGAGYEAEAILKGLGEYEGIREIYLSHLRTIIE